VEKGGPREGSKKGSKKGRNGVILPRFGAVDRRETRIGRVEWLSMFEKWIDLWT